MRPMFAFVAAGALLAGCEQQAAVNQADNGADGNAAAAENAGAAMADASAPLGAPVSGDQAKALMEERHEGMEDIGDAMKILSREMKADAPDLAAVRPNAATIARLSQEAPGWFPPGTGPDVGKTRAKAEIWQRPEDFAAKARTFGEAAQAFNAAAQGTDVAAMKAAHGELGKSCKACHDDYRAPEH